MNMMNSIFAWDRVVVALVFVAFLVVSGCPTACADTLKADLPAGGQVSLFDTEWQLISYTVAGSQEAVIPGSDVTLTLVSGGDANGHGGINLYFGSYTMEGSTLRFGEIGSTLMAGDKPLMDQESAFFGLLGRVEEYHLSGNTLTLLDARGNTLLVFQPATTGSLEPAQGIDPSQHLPGTSWELISYSDGTSMVSGNDVHVVTLEFTDDANLAGFSGVNQYFAGYTLSGNSISVGSVGSTKMAGPEPRMALEQAYLDILGKVTTVRLYAARLELLDSSGNVVLSYKTAEGTRENNSGTSTTPVLGRFGSYPSYTTGAFTQGHSNIHANTPSPSRFNKITGHGIVLEPGPVIIDTLVCIHPPLRRNVSSASPANTLKNPLL